MVVICICDHLLLFTDDLFGGNLDDNTSTGQQGLSEGNILGCPQKRSTIAYGQSVWSHSLWWE